MLCSFVLRVVIELLNKLLVFILYCVCDYFVRISADCDSSINHYVHTYLPTYYIAYLLAHSLNFEIIPTLT